MTPTLTLYTIGHSNHAIETFVGLLRAGGVRRIAESRKGGCSIDG